MKFLSNEEIRRVAPSVFQNNQLEGLSEHYTHIPTTRVMSDMELLGWKPVKANEVKSRVRQGFQKHILTFQNPDVTITSSDGDIVIPQIILMNSHDGKSKFRFAAGLFRLVCSNGLVIADEEFANLEIRHMGYTFEELQDIMNRIVEKLPLTVESMNKMSLTELDREAQIEFAIKCIETRFEETQIIKLDIDSVLNPIRNEDMGNDLWSVFNVVQEKVLAGGFDVISTKGKVRKAREVKNFVQDQEINKDLYRVALEFMN